jgi:hypothetical protein
MYFFLKRKKELNLINFLKLFSLFYFIILLVFFLFDLYEQFLLYSYDINKNGIFEENEQSVEQKRLFNKNDIGLNLAPIYIILPSALLSVLYLTFRYFIKKSKNNIIN